MHFSGLSFQPWIVGPSVVAAILLRSPSLFLALSVVLSWSAFLPRWNPFELFCNSVVAARRGKPQLAPAPPARRFAQGMAAEFMLFAALALLAGWTMAAWILEAFLVIAVSALTFVKFCLGAYVYHLLRGKVRFANATLPWAGRQS